MRDVGFTGRMHSTRLVGGLFHDVGHGVGDRGLEHDGLGMEAGEVHTHELSGLEYRGQRKILAPQAGQRQAVCQNKSSPSKRERRHAARMLRVGYGEVELARKWTERSAPSLTSGKHCAPLRILTILQSLVVDIEHGEIDVGIVACADGVAVVAPHHVEALVLGDHLVVIAHVIEGDGGVEIDRRRK